MSTTETLKDAIFITIIIVVAIVTAGLSCAPFVWLHNLSTNVERIANALEGKNVERFQEVK